MKIDISDIISVAGIGLTAYGIYLLKPEVLFIYFGSILTVVGLVRGVRWFGSNH